MRLCVKRTSPRFTTRCWTVCATTPPTAVGTWAHGKAAGAPGPLLVPAAVSLRLDRAVPSVSCSWSLPCAVPSSVCSWDGTVSVGPAPSGVPLFSEKQQVTQTVLSLPHPSPVVGFPVLIGESSRKWSPQRGRLGQEGATLEEGGDGHHGPRLLVMGNRKPGGAQVTVLGGNLTQLSPRGSPEPREGCGCGSIHVLVWYLLTSAAVAFPASQATFLSAVKTRPSSPFTGGAESCLHDFCLLFWMPCGRGWGCHVHGVTFIPMQTEVELYIKAQKKKEGNEHVFPDLTRFWPHFFKSPLPSFPPARCPVSPNENSVAPQP